jgi:hypothetical protein
MTLSLPRMTGRRTRRNQTVRPLAAWVSAELRSALRPYSGPRGDPRGCAALVPLGLWSLPPDSADPWQWPWGTLTRRAGYPCGPGLEPADKLTGETTNTRAAIIGAVAGVEAARYAACLAVWEADDALAAAWAAVAELDRMFLGWGPAAAPPAPGPGLPRLRGR